MRNPPAFRGDTPARRLNRKGPRRRRGDEGANGRAKATRSWGKGTGERGNDTLAPDTAQ